MEKGKILLALTGFHPQRWREPLAAEREVVLEPDGPSDPSIAYAVVWKQKPNLLSSLPNLRAIFSIGAGPRSTSPELKTVGAPELPSIAAVMTRLISSTSPARSNAPLAPPPLSSSRSASCVCWK